MTAGGDGSLSLWRHNIKKNGDDDDSVKVTAGAKKRVSPCSQNITRNSHICGGSGQILSVPSKAAFAVPLSPCRISRNVLIKRLAAKLGSAVR